MRSSEAFFALLSRDMLLLSEKYKKPIEELHQMFLSVSCDRAQLVKLLEAKGEKNGVVTWNTLEDLALTNGPENVTYQLIAEEKTLEEVWKRKTFLEIPRE